MSFHKSGTVVKLSNLKNTLEPSGFHYNHGLNYTRDANPDTFPHPGVHSGPTIFVKHGNLDNSSSSNSSGADSDLKNGEHIQDSTPDSSSPEVSIRGSKNSTNRNSAQEKGNGEEAEEDAEDPVKDVIVTSSRQISSKGKGMGNDVLRKNAHHRENEHYIDDAYSHGNDAYSKKPTQAVQNAKEFSSWLLKNTKPQLMLDFNIDENANAKDNDQLFSDQGVFLKADSRLKVQIVKVQNYLAHYYMLLESTNGNFNPLRTIRNRKLQHNDIKSNHRDTFRKTNVVTDPPCIPVLVFSNKNRNKKHKDLVSSGGGGGGGSGGGAGGGGDKSENTLEKIQTKIHHHHSRTGIVKTYKKTRSNKKRAKFVYWKWFLGVNERYDDLNWERLQVLRTQMNSADNLKDEDSLDEHAVKEEPNNSHFMNGITHLDEKYDGSGDNEHVEDVMLAKKDSEHAPAASSGVLPPKLVVTNNSNENILILDNALSRTSTRANASRDDTTPYYSLTSSPNGSRSTSQALTRDFINSNKSELFTQLNASQGLRSDTESISSSMNEEPSVSDLDEQDRIKELSPITETTFQGFHSLEQSCREVSTAQGNRDLQYKELQYFKAVQKIFMTQHANMRLSYNNDMLIYNKHQYQHVSEQKIVKIEENIKNLKKIKMVDTKSYSDMLPSSNEIEDLILSSDRILTEINTTLTLRLKLCGNVTPTFMDEEDDNGYIGVPTRHIFDRVCRNKDKVFYYIIEYVIKICFRMIWLLFTTFKALLSLVGL